VKVRQSASLVAGVCTLCVAASTSVTPVLAEAASTPGQDSPVVRPFELTAASDVLVDGVNVAGLPLRNLVTVLTALAICAAINYDRVSKLEVTAVHLRLQQGELEQAVRGQKIHARLSDAVLQKHGER